MVAELCLTGATQDQELGETGKGRERHQCHLKIHIPSNQALYHIFAFLHILGGCSTPGQDSLLKKTWRRAELCRIVVFMSEVVGDFPTFLQTRSCLHWSMYSKVWLAQSECVSLAGASFRSHHSGGSGAQAMNIVKSWTATLIDAEPFDSGSGRCWVLCF